MKSARENNETNRKNCAEESSGRFGRLERGEDPVLVRVVVNERCAPWPVAGGEPDRPSQRVVSPGRAARTAVRNGTTQTRAM